MHLTKHSILHTIGKEHGGAGVAQQIGISSVK